MQNHCVLGAIKQTALLKFMMELDISYFLIMGSLIKFVIKLNILQVKKGGITDSVNHNFARTRNDSYDSLPIEKILTFHNVIILIKSVVNKNKNEYYYNIFLQKGLYKDKS